MSGRVHKHKQGLLKPYTTVLEHFLHDNVRTVFPAKRSSSLMLACNVQLRLGFTDVSGMSHLALHLETFSPELESDKIAKVFPLPLGSRAGNFRSLKYF